ncbi:hypothetical protein C1752_03754 [Acaryochloris thomasi RCC1774]|uniref:Uncharacterized protein n=1 Tax=Acaryochloris thomasi RCC1774 TaxID=1764569 RepID=A0A2W1JES7_9CYAN|nr:DUF1816 domain-containing protein [Acaryochloris thomasi]PZD72168.1 hypothetical protein C1752_03754 [Acaryochloris thomasi RCC1774]
MNHISQIIQNTVLVILAFLVLSILLRKGKSYETSPQEDDYDQAWWVTVTTQQPNYEYLFGPFKDKKEAEENLSGYIKDLADEGAIQIEAEVCWCKPQAITRDLRQISA